MTRYSEESETEHKRQRTHSISRSSSRIPPQSSFHNSESVDSGSARTPPQSSLDQGVDSGSESDNFQRFEQFFEKPALVGPTLNTSLARIINKVGQPPNKEDLKSLRTEYVCPQNVPNLRTPTTNPEIWHLMDQRKQEVDKKIQNSLIYLFFL